MIDRIVTKDKGFSRLYRIICSTARYCYNRAYRNSFIHDIRIYRLIFLSSLELWFHKYQSIRIQNFIRVIIDTYILVAIILLTCFIIGSGNKYLGNHKIRITCIEYMNLQFQLVRPSRYGHILLYSLYIDFHRSSILWVSSLTNESYIIQPVRQFNTLSRIGNVCLDRCIYIFKSIGSTGQLQPLDSCIYSSGNTYSGYAHFVIITTCGKSQHCHKKD